MPPETVDDLIAGVCLERMDACLDSVRGILPPAFSDLGPLVLAPILMVCGRFEVTITVNYSLDLTNLITNAREVVIEAAHLSIWENPVMFD
jgi:hypothetical protein